MQHQLSFDFFKETLPKKPYASNCKTSPRIMSLEHAIQQAYIQHNQPAMANWLIFDIDHDDVYRFYELNLPYPNYIVINKNNGHYHIAYAIKAVCTSPKANVKNLRLLALVERAYQNALNADLNYSGLLSKNPMSDQWLVWLIHNNIQDLHYLSDFNGIDLDNAAEELWGKKRHYGPKPNGFGRHCHIFDNLRFWAYGEVSHHNNYDSFFNACLSKAESLNNYDEPLPFSHLKYTAKSVSKWTWQHREGFKNYKQVNRGIMCLNETPLTLEEKQSVASERTCMIRRENTEKQVKKAIKDLKDKGTKVTKAEVARMINMSRTRISTHYSHLFK